MGLKSKSSVNFQLIRYPKINIPYLHLCYLLFQAPVQAYCITFAGRGAGGGGAGGKGKKTPQSGKLDLEIFYQPK